MMWREILDLRSMEGSPVSVTLKNGSHLDGVLISSGRGRTNTLWVYANETDLLISVQDVCGVSNV
jgi:hypothetical protein